MTQLGLGAYRWETPHGLARVVTGHGTQRIQLLKNPNGDTMGELYDTPAGVQDLLVQIIDGLACRASRFLAGPLCQS